MAAHTLYRFFDDAGSLLYVGITCNPGRRLEKHRDGKEWWAAVSTITMEQHADRQTLLAAERSAIHSERPRYNIRLNGHVPSPAEPPGQLRRGLQVGGVYALALDDGSCPVGLVESGDDEGVVINPFSWFTGSFTVPAIWISVDAVVRWMRAEVMSEHQKNAEGWDPKLTVFDMDPLGAYQTKWTSLYRQVEESLRA